MKVELQVTPKITITAESDTCEDAFTQLAEMSQVFGNGKCEKCKCEDLEFVRREVAGQGKKSYTYYELRCKNYECKAKLKFSKSDDGDFYPQRYQRTKDADGKPTYVFDDDGRKIQAGKWGWVRWNKDTGQEE
jgi:hypothetical protein